MHKMLAIIDASTQLDLDKLTRHRMPGALPFAGKYRLIDFTLSSIMHAGITNVAIFPQGNYRSLQDHIGSGKRWNLDRRKDGLFILPPKNIGAQPYEMITFQRMHEHIEYFKRSVEPYVLIVPAHIVWNIDFETILTHHSKANKDITQIIVKSKRLKTFIVAREWLLKQILEYDVSPYKTMLDIVKGSPSVRVNTYLYEHPVRVIDSVYGYHSANLAMLEETTVQAIFKADRPILSKEKTAPPVSYHHHANVENSMISSGCSIDGTLKNCVIGRDVTIEKDAVVLNSVIMSNTRILAHAYVENAILDKGTIVKENTVLIGSKTFPYLSQKEQVISKTEQLNILLVASECQPFVKTGGLADVIGDLARHLIEHGANTTVFLPLYQSIKERFEADLKPFLSKIIEYDNEPYKITIYHTNHRKVDVYFLESFKWYERDNIYGYDDDCDRYAFLSYTLTQVLEELGTFDIVHAHDWHTALVPYLLEKYHVKPPKTLLTLHNVDYQGICPANILQKMKIPLKDVPTEKLNYLEMGIQHATMLSTVSPTYRDELRTEYFGKNLTPALLRRERDFYGILNGISNTNSPKSDSLIRAPYDSNSLDNKRLNKQFLQQEMKLNTDPLAFVIGSVSRIAEQKGFDLTIPVIEWFIKNHHDVQFVLLGSGDPEYVRRLKKLAQSYPKQVAVNLTYDATIPNYIYAGSDLFIMPSRVEPCGLAQMIAMRYGALPLVRKTGGLADTVTAHDPLSEEGTGFTFYTYTTEALRHTLEEAYHLFKNDAPTWQRMMQRAMTADFSLDKQALKMLELYKLML